MNIQIEKLKPNQIREFQHLIRLFEKVFEMKDFVLPPESHLRNLLEKDNFLVFVATRDEEILGGLTAYILEQYYSQKPLVYIYDLAVDSQHQRMGIGKKLMQAIIGDCKQHGMEEVFVQADEPDQHAVDFYHSTGGLPEKVIHFYYPLNPGQ